MDINARPSFFRGPFLSFNAILENRSLLSLMVRRDLKTTYGDYYLGYAWTLLEPIFFTMVFYLVFIILRGNPDRLLPLNIMLGILIYSAFSKNCLSRIHPISTQFWINQTGIFCKRTLNC